MTAESRDKQLGRLWQQAFGDPAETVDAFFRTGFSPNRCHILWADEKIVSALYWFDCFVDDQKIAYIYAVATDEAYRGRGLAHRLMEETHGILQNRGYLGAILVPGSVQLQAFYEGIGYRAATSVTEFSAAWGNEPQALNVIDPDRYAQLRRQYLPAGGVVQEGETLAYLQTYTKFYAGENFLLAAAREGNTLLAQEFLGDTKAIPGILRALRLPEGRFRIPGSGREFSMFLPLREGCSQPAYFGLALD